MAAVRKRQWTTPKGEPRSAWIVDYVDRDGERGRKLLRTKRDADAFRVEIEGQLRAGTFRPDASKVTVADLAELFLDYCRGRMERHERMTRHNLAGYRGHLRNHVLHPDHGVATLNLARLTARSVLELRDRLRAAGVSVPTTRKVLTTLHAMLEFAIGRDLIAFNPAKGVRVIGRRDEGSRKIVPPSKDDLRRIIEAADPGLRTRIVFAAATGLRAGEFHALRWKHLNLLKGEVLVETRVDAYGEEDVTKTLAGMRSVPLAADIVTMMKEWRLSSKFSAESDLVFPNGRGRYEQHDNLMKRGFLPVCERAGVPRVTWHALRHFAISCWIEAGLKPKIVQVFAGHSSLQVTMDRYGHLFPSEDHRHAMDAIAGAVFGRGV
jgi:integrase